MASAKDDHQESLDLDNASFIFHNEGGATPAEDIANPKHIPPIAQKTVTKSEQLSVKGNSDNHQRSQANETGSWLDSSRRENSPYGSPKYDNLAITGKSSLEISRQQRIPNGTNARIEEGEQQSTFGFANGYMERQTGPYAQETACNSGLGKALALSGSRTEIEAFTQRHYIDVMPNCEMHSSVNDNHYINDKEAELASADEKEDKYMDNSMRLITYFSKPVEWPHTTPSAEEMANAGLIFLGAFNVGGTTVYDMVECHKCKGRLHGFTKDDDPVEEHRREFPNCN